MISWYFWDPNGGLWPFRKVCFVLCLISAGGWYVSGSLMRMPNSGGRVVAVPGQNKEDGTLHHDVEQPTPHSPPPPLSSDKGSINGAPATTTTTTTTSTLRSEFKQWSMFVKQLVAQPPFLQYVSLNFIMNFNYFLSDSFLIFLDQKLMVKVMPPWFRLAITTLALYVPKFGVQLMTPYANKHGLHALITGIIQASIVVGVVALMVGRNVYYVWGLLVVVQRFLLSSWGFYDLIMADVIDNDRVKHQRRTSVATSIHGVQSLFVKPAQSLAPMCGAWILTATMGNGGGGGGGGGATSGGEGQTMGAEGQVGNVVNVGSVSAGVGQMDGVYWLTFGLPLICSFVQLFIWSKYTLKGEQLKQIKTRVAALM